MNTESHEIILLLNALLALAIESWTLGIIVLAYAILTIHRNHA
jgi:hypothetical protein